MSSTSNGHFGMLEDYSMWQDFENNKVYVKCGTEIIEVPHAIAEAYRQYKAESFRLYFRLYRAMVDRSDRLTTENTKLRSMRDTWQENDVKLRELIADMWRSAMVYCDFAARLAFIDEFIDRMRELGIEV